MRRQDWTMMEEYMQQCMKDSAHDMQHVRRVVSNAVEIACGEVNVNMDVLLAAALLHDVGRADELTDPTVNHAVTGSERAYRFLLGMGYPESFAEHVRQCIRTHRFRNIDPPATIEAKILFDADKLDVCGAIGIARTLMYSGEHHRPIYTTEPDGTISDGNGDREDSFFREYRFKLDGMYSRFMTLRGAELAASRKKAARDFYAALLDEVRQEAGTKRLAALIED